jgi:prepilin-type N-terminal cleavage/methylation domain-containing protein
MRTRGFTLIELLVSLVIIGLLTTAATASFLSAQRNSRDDARKTSVQAIANSLEAYKLVNQIYPGKTDASDTTNCAANSTYYYNANTATCTPAAGASATLFTPAPSWIPDLGRYLNPPPLEVRYTGSDGATTTAGTFDATTGAPTNSTRTLSFKRTASGYQINAKLEQGTVYSLSK